MQKRQLTVAERLQEGDVLFLPRRTPRTVLRTTGAPGRPPKDGRRWVRVFVAGSVAPFSLKEQTPVAISPRA